MPAELSAIPVRPGRNPVLDRARRALWAAAGLAAAVTVAAIATNNPGATGLVDELELVSPGDPADGAGAVAAPAIGVTGGVSSPVSGGGAVGGSNGGSPPAGSPAGAVPPVPPAPVAPGGSGGGSARPPSGPDDTSVAIVTPTLAIVEFGSRVGLPLVCGTAAGALSGPLATLEATQVAATIATTCLEMGTQGAEALRAMDEALADLAAANAATVPLIEALVDAFNTMGSQDVPFAESLTSLGRLLGFFAGTGTGTSAR